MEQFKPGHSEIAAIYDDGYMLAIVMRHTLGPYWEYRFVSFDEVVWG